jgi:hypothetical protein
MPGFNIQGSGNNSPNHLVEFHRAHRWIIEALGTEPTQPKERLYAQSIQLPSVTFEEEKIKSGAAVEYKIAKKASWQDFTIKFYDVYGLYKLFDTWQKKVWNADAGIGRANDYKSDVILVLTDGEGKEKQKYTAFGAYPKSITHGDLSYASSDVKLLTVTYSYDFAKMVFMDVGSGGTPTGGSVMMGGPPPFVSTGGALNGEPSVAEQARQDQDDRRTIDNGIQSALDMAGIEASSLEPKELAQLRANVRQAAGLPPIAGQPAADPADGLFASPTPPE